MILDKELMMSDAQDLGALSDATIVSTNYIDLGNAGNANKGTRLRVDVGEAFADGTSVNIILQSDDNAAFASATTLYQTGAVVTASLTAYSNQVDIELPRGCEQYVRMAYTGVGTFTAGKVTASLLMDTPMNQS